MRASTIQLGRVVEIAFFSTYLTANHPKKIVWKKNVEILENKSSILHSVTALGSWELRGEVRRGAGGRNV